MYDCLKNSLRFYVNKFNCNFHLRLELQLLAVSQKGLCSMEEMY
jgi:hypothetical protein